MRKKSNRKSNIQSEVTEGVKKLHNAIEKKKIRFSLLTVLIIVFLMQLTCGLIVNSAKIYSLRTKISKLEKINKVAERKNQYLREELEKYTSNTGVEALARNRLQFSKEDETLVIIKTPQEDEQEEKE